MQKTTVRVEGDGIKVGDKFLAKGLSSRDVTQNKMELWGGNYQANLPLLKKLPSMKNLYGLFKDKGDTFCICVGNGPTFHSNVGTLRIIKDRYNPFIISSDRTFATLKDAGIKPDITMSVDGQEHVSDFFPDGYVEHDDFFASVVYTHPKTLERMSRGHVFWGIPQSNEETHFKWGMEAGTDYFCLNANWVVGTALIHLGAKMGFTVVGALGNDLSFKGESIDAFDTAYRKFNIEAVVEEKTGRRNKYVTCDPFFLAANACNKFPKWYENTTFIDFSNAPVVNFGKMKLQEVLFLKFDAFDYKMKMMKAYR